MNISLKNLSLKAKIGGGVSTVVAVIAFFVLPVRAASDSISCGGRYIEQDGKMCWEDTGTLATLEHFSTGKTYNICVTEQGNPVGLSCVGSN